MSEASSTRKKKSRLRRGIGIAVGTVAATAVFAGGAVSGVLLHLDLPATRRTVATQVTGVLRGVLAGQIILERVDAIGLRGLAGVRARILDPEGKEVLFVDGVRVRFDAISAGRSALFGKGDIQIHVASLSIDHVSVSIDGDPSGELRLVRAFAPKNPSTAPEPPPDPNARGVSVEAPEVILTHAWVHGTAPAAPPVDVELTDLRADGHYDPKLTRADLRRVTVFSRGMLRAADPRGRIIAHFAMPSATGASMGGNAEFDGTIANISTRADAKLDGEAVDGKLDIHGATGDRLRAIASEIPIQDELDAHAEVHGTLKEMKAKANLRLGPGTVDAEADVSLGDATRVAATVGVRHFDLRAAAPDVPASDLGLDTRATVTLARDGGIAGDFSLQTLAGTVAGDDVPRLDAKGTFTGESAAVTGSIDDARAPTRFVVAMNTVDGKQIVNGEIDARVPDLSRLPKIGRDARGSAYVHASGKANLGDKTLAARAEVTGQSLAYGAEKVGTVRVGVTAEGALERPELEVDARATGIEAGGQVITSVTAKAGVAIGPPIVVSRVGASVVKDGVPVDATVDRVTVDGARIVVDGAVVRGLGEPIRARVAQSPGELRVKLEAPSIDVVRVATLAAQPDQVKEGTLALDADLVLRGGGAQGEVHARLDALSAHAPERAKVDADVRFVGTTLGVDLEASVGAAGRASIHTNEVVLGGGPLDPASWKRAKGRAKVDAQVDLTKAVALVPRGALPLGELSGLLTMAGSIRRDSADVPPEASIHVHTRGLVVAGPTNEKGIPAWKSRGVDVAFDTRVDATSGAAEVAVRAWDGDGTLVAFEAKTRLPYAEILADPSSALARAERAPLSAKLLVPRRSLDRLPDVAGVRGFEGTLEAQLDVTGTALEPKVDFVARGRDLRAPSLPAALTSDADVTLAYDGKAADLGAVVKTGKGDAKKETLTLASHVDAVARELLETPPGKEPAWKGSAKVTLASFALESLEPLADRRIRGKVSGSVTLDDLHENAKLHADVALDALKVGRATYKGARVVVDAHDGKVAAHARLDQENGYADLKASAGLAWGAALAPSPDPTVDTEASFDAKGLRAAAALPFLSGAVNDLDGIVDANAKVHIPAGASSVPVMEGKVSFQRGRIALAALGDELQDVRATVSLSKEGVIRIDDVFARSLDGQVFAHGVVRTRGLGLDTATLEVKIPEDHKLDVALQGSPLGEVWGDVKVDAKGSADGKRIDLGVGIPRFSLELPQNMKSGVQPLERNDQVDVGVLRDRASFVALPLDRADLEPPAPPEKGSGSTVVVDVKLGEIQLVYGRMARLVATGNPVIVLENGKTKASGQVSVKEGKVDVQGKKFEIEKATVTLREDIGNPVVLATAAWTAEDGTRIYADFTGPVKTGKVTLRSEPTRPKNEILATILFGTADGANAQPNPKGSTGSQTKLATSAGGGIAAEGLTNALDDLTGIEATARIDTSRSNNPAPELELQVSRRVSLAIQHVLGTPPPSAPDKNLATVDWRFQRNWSLETTVGDRGKGQVDAVWQKRY